MASDSKMRHSARVNAEARPCAGLNVGTATLRVHRGEEQPEQSFSERQIYQSALARLTREFAAIEQIDEESATERLETVLRAA